MTIIRLLILLVWTNVALAGGFDLPSPDSSKIAEHRDIWATWYFTPQFKSKANGLPLLDMQNNSLGVALAKHEWCSAAMEGSVNIDGVTFNYAGRGYLQVDCSEFFPHRVGTIRYRKAIGPYGDGVLNYILVPYRTIAVDPTFIPYGTVFYIPAAVGTKLHLPDGTTAVHDGYFFAGDTGGAILENHFDVFIGTNNNNPFEFISNTPRETYDAYVIDDEQIINYMKSLHIR